MGRRGPKPTPTNVLKTRGSWRAKTRTDEPAPPPGRANCPRWLPERGKQKWRELAPQLEAMGVLSRIDSGALARYCSLWHLWRQAQEVIESEGPVTQLFRDGEHIGDADRPEVARLMKLGDQLARLENSFGLTPSARAALHVSAAPKKPAANDSLEERVFGKAQ